MRARLSGLFRRKDGLLVDRDSRPGSIEAEMLKVLLRTVAQTGRAGLGRDWSLSTDRG